MSGQGSHQRVSWILGGYGERGRTRIALKVLTRFALIALAVALAGPAVSGGPSAAAAAGPQGAERFVGQGVRAFKVKRKLVALTFDDGPSDYTAQLVEALDRRRAHGTFFWVASRMDTETAMYVTAHGEEIGSHNYDHNSLTAPDLESDLVSVQKADDTITSMTGTRPFWFRSPCNRIDLTGRVALGMTGHGLVNWGVNPKDYLEGRSPKQITSYVLKNVRPGSFVQLHETRATAAALPSILAGLKKRGYKVVTLSELASASSGYKAW